MGTTDKIEIKNGDIVEIAQTYHVDAVVNAAKRTLMGGSGVDGSIHNAIDSINNKSDFFKEKIKEELKDTINTKDDIIRCDYGNAVVTKGYGLADYVIHAVGPRWDGNDKIVGGSASKTCIDKLKSCYTSILNCMVKYGCNSIAIPVISSGSYRFPFSTAAKIEFAAVCNFLTDLKNHDIERFDKIKKIYIVVFNQEDIACFRSIFDESVRYVDKGKQLLYLTTAESHMAYLKEVKCYDSERRNYFSTVKYFRLLLIKSEKFLFVNYSLQKLFADTTWEGRRTFIEIETIIKCLLPLIILFISPYISPTTGIVLTVISFYLMLETLAYATKLLCLSDILNPSANSIRSVLLLSINYLEINFCFAFFYRLYGCFKYKGRLACLYAAFEHSSQVPITLSGMFLVCLQNCITLYFVGIVLTHFINNFQSKKSNVI